MSAGEDFTVLLQRASGGDRTAQSAVWQSAYDELHVMAQGIRSTFGSHKGYVPSPTTVIHEAFLKAFGTTGVCDWENRAHFFGTLARAMGQVLVDWKRTDTRLKRGGVSATGSLGDFAGSIPDLKPLDDFDAAMRELSPHLVAVLEQLQIDAPEIADVVWLRYVAGLRLNTTAVILGIRPRTVSKRWNLGRAHLRSTLRKAMESDLRETTVV